MPPIMVTDNPLICYCGRATRIYDSLFGRNFCSDECSTALRLFLGGTDKAVAIMQEIRASKAGDFQIKGSVVTLHETLAKHQIAKTSTIDKIDAQVQVQLERDKLRAEFKRKFPTMPDTVIEAMLNAKGA